MLCAASVLGGTLRLEIENVNPESVVTLTLEECEKAFDRGYSGPNRCAASTGVGLDSVRTAAIAVNGHVKLRTRVEGIRTLTALLLEMPAAPCSPPSSASKPALVTATPEAQPTCIPAEGLHVLVADDVAVNRMMMIRTLKRLFPGARFMQAARAQEAFQLYVEFEFGLIVTDEHMASAEDLVGATPETILLGSDFIAAVRKREALQPGRPHAIIVSCTASDPESVPIVWASGPDLVLPMPFRHPSPFCFQAILDASVHR